MSTLKKLHSEGFNWLACNDDGDLFAYEVYPYPVLKGVWDADGKVKPIENIYEITYDNGPLRIENIMNKDVYTNTIKENINNKHDDHYKALKIEPWEIMKADFTKEELKGFFKGNILKYLLRNKEGVKDIDKLINYAQELKKLMESGE